MNYKAFSAILAILLIGAIGYIVYSNFQTEESSQQEQEANLNTPPASNINTPPSNSNDAKTNTSSVNQSSSQTLPAGQERVSGTFSAYSIGLAPGVLSFKVDSGPTNLPKGTYFNFLNQTQAHTAFKTSEAGTLGEPGCDFIEGKAEIIISNFSKANTNQSESTNTANLISVSKIIQTASCVRGTSN